MGIGHILEDFGSFTQDVIVTGDMVSEDQKLESFETGYKAGWDDAVKAQQDDTRRISVDFAKNLEDIQFTYEDAFQGVLRNLRPLLEVLVNKALPQMARATLGQQVVEMLQAALQKDGRGTIDVLTSPQNVTALEDILKDKGFDTVSIRAEETLGEGQVHLSANGTELSLDLEALLSEIETAVQDFFNTPNPTQIKDAM